jgi:hypothetical protein
LVNFQRKVEVQSLLHYFLEREVHEGGNGLSGFAAGQALHVQILDLHGGHLGEGRGGGGGKLPVEFT